MPRATRRITTTARCGCPRHGRNRWRRRWRPPAFRTRSRASAMAARRESACACGCSRRIPMGTWRFLTSPGCPTPSGGGSWRACSRKSRSGASTSSLTPTMCPLGSSASCGRSLASSGPSPTSWSSSKAMPRASRKTTTRASASCRRPGQRPSAPPFASRAPRTRCVASAWAARSVPGPASMCAPRGPRTLRRARWRSPASTASHATSRRMC
mmetsp:Transcript_46593/g.135700  ORF Transcript_46593/g.135700 Transcript_46593/m.135700 type:complete len:212 (-) Transcript_46593:821-1456(-)